MSDSQDSTQQNPEANPQPENIRKGRRKLESRDLGLIDAIIAAWVVILTIFAAFYYEHHRIAAYSIVAAIACALGLGLFLEHRHRWSRKRLVAWKVVVPLILLHVLFLGSATTLILREFGRPPMGLMVVTSIVSHRSPGVFGWFMPNTFRVVSLTSSGKVSAPVDILTYLAISNTSQEPITLGEYGLEVSENRDGPWLKVCRVDLRTRWLYSATDQKQAVAINADNSLDVKLSEKPIPAAGLTAGWTAWVCPEGRLSECVPKFLRVTLNDISGHTTEHVISNRIEDHQQPSLLSPELHIGNGREDISGAIQASINCP